MSRTRSVLLAVMAMLAFSGCALLFPVSMDGTAPSPVVVQVTAAP